MVPPIEVLIELFVHLRGSKGSMVRLLFFLCIYLTGCFSTDLPAIEAPSGLDKLKKLTETTVPVRIDVGDLSQQKLGYQYLLVALPFTRIYGPNLKSDTELQFSVAGALRGYRFREALPTSERFISLSVVSADLDGYDLLFIRKPTASVTLTAVMYDHGTVVRSCQEIGEASNTAHYAFSIELQSALAEALLQASYKTLDCLGLTESK